MENSDYESLRMDFQQFFVPAETHLLIPPPMNFLKHTNSSSSPFTLMIVTSLREQAWETWVS